VLCVCPIHNPFPRKQVVNHMEKALPVLKLEKKGTTTNNVVEFEDDTFSVSELRAAFPGTWDEWTKLIRQDNAEIQEFLRNSKRVVKKTKAQTEKEQQSPVKKRRGRKPKAKVADATSPNKPKATAVVTIGNDDNNSINNKKDTNKDNNNNNDNNSKNNRNNNNNNNHNNNVQQKETIVLKKPLAVEKRQNNNNSRSVASPVSPTSPVSPPAPVAVSTRPDKKVKRRFWTQQEELDLVAVCAIANWCGLVFLSDLCGVCVLCFVVCVFALAGYSKVWNWQMEGNCIG
jgi:hypothetical protein